MSGDNLRVSVIIPVYNREGLIKATLSSILAQTHPADEIIVVDDGSTDKSAEIAESFGPNIQVIRAENGGPARARNIGFAASTGDLILFFDSDDLATNNYIESRYEAIMAGADIAYGPLVRFWEVEGVLELDQYVRQSAAVLDPIDAFLKSWVLLIQCCLIRRSVLEAVGGYPEGLFSGEDMLLLWKMLRRNADLMHTNRSLLFLRQHPLTQISTAPEHSKQRIIDELMLTDAVLSDIDGLTNHKTAIRKFKARRTRAFLQAEIAGVLSEIASKDMGAFPTNMDKLISNGDAFRARIFMRLQFYLEGHRLPRYYHARKFNDNDSTIAESLDRKFRVKTRRVLVNSHG